MHQFRTIFQDNLLIAASPDNDAKSPKLFWALPQSFETQNQACSKMIKDYISNIFLRLISWYFFHLCQCCCLQSTSLYFWCQVFGETLSLPIVGQVASSTISFFVFFLVCSSQDRWRQPLFHFFVSCIFSLFTFSMFLFTSHHINGGRETVCLAHRGIGGPGRGGLENLTATRATPAR